MSIEDREPYINMAIADKARWENNMVEYVKQHSGDDAGGAGATVESLDCGARAKATATMAGAGAGAVGGGGGTKQPVFVVEGMLDGITMEQIVWDQVAVVLVPAPHVIEQRRRKSNRQKGKGGKSKFGKKEVKRMLISQLGELGFFASKQAGSSEAEEDTTASSSSESSSSESDSPSEAAAVDDGDGDDGGGILLRVHDDAAPGTEQLPPTAAIPPLQFASDAAPSHVSLSPAVPLLATVHEETKWPNLQHSSSRNERRPPHSYTELAYNAILSHPDGAATVQEIYLLIGEEHPFYKITMSAPHWKSSIRYGDQFN
jgi:hypothetical protein